MQRYLPDPWLFAIVLTFVVFLMGIGLIDSSALEMVRYWGEGLFGLLEFSMQMVLILLTGYVLGHTGTGNGGSGPADRSRPEPGGDGRAWGDAWTNMVQPFWLLPALGIAGLKARDVMGYCVVALIVSGVIITAGLLLLT